MKFYLRALAAERLKMKRTLAAWVVLIAPLVVVFMYTMIMIRTRESYFNDPEAWLGEIKSILSMWSILMLPLFITLQSGLIAHSEHSNNTWKYLYTLPIPRWTIFAAKWTMNTFLVFLSSALCLLFTIGAGLFMRYAFPGNGFTDPFPWEYALTIHGKVFLAAMFIISIHTWISLNWKSLVIAFGTGMVAVVVNLTIIMSDKWGAIFPWSLPLYSYSVQGANPVQIFSIALGGGLLAAILGAVWISRKQVY